jgi:hypothetical protein
MGRITPDRLPTRTGCGAGGRLLGAGTMVMALGLGAIMASPAPFPKDRGDVAELRPPMVIDGGDAQCPDPFPKEPATPPAMLRSLAGKPQDAPASAPVPRRSAPPHPHGVD